MMASPSFSAVHDNTKVGPQPSGLQAVRGTVQFHPARLPEFWIVHCLLIPIPIR